MESESSRKSRVQTVEVRETRSIRVTADIPGPKNGMTGKAYKALLPLLPKEKPRKYAISSAASIRMIRSD